MNRYGFKIFQYKKAQQLVEFLLVVPFMVIILGILTEYAYALNINMTLKEGLKMATTSIYSQIKPGMEESDIEELVKNNLITYLAANNVPVNSENITEKDVGYALVGKVETGQMAVFMASYTYIPSFTLPNVYFHFLPDKFTFFATSAVPGAFLGSTGAYSDSGVIKKSVILDKIWSASDFASVTFNGIKKGIMNNMSADSGRDEMIFMVPPPSKPNTYVLVKWNGTVKNCTLTVDKDTKTFSFSGSETGCSGNFVNYLAANKKYNVIFVDNRDRDLANVGSDLSLLSSYWLFDPGAKVSVPTATVDNTDISASNIDGILKRSLALITASAPGNPSTSIGNYDDNSMTYGSIVFVGIDADTFGIITTGADSPPTRSSFPNE